MIDKISNLLKEVEQFNSTVSDEIEKFRISYLGKKGIISGLFDEFKSIPNEQKKAVGQHLNQLKQAVQQKTQNLKQSSKASSSDNQLDLFASSEPIKLGSRHPVTIIRNEIISIFSKIGFSVSEGPDIEDDWHVFSGLNFPEEHPARDMQDTFFIQNNPDILLRTHTSSVQVRVMEKTNPPIRKLLPGRCFRNEAISTRSHVMFHQIEGLYIDESVSFADLKQCLLFFAQELFGSETTIRFRPSYFPFTEPSAEMDISCSICGGKGCRVCKYTGFLEILGCGMVDPNVLESSSIDSKKYSGYAFGMGIERIAMLKYQINDIRIFFDNDVRFLKQFSTNN